MSHSPEQNRQKAAARAEAMIHAEHATVDGSQRRDHRVDSREDEMNRGFARNDGDSDGNHLAIKRIEGLQDPETLPKYKRV